MKFGEYFSPKNEVAPVEKKESDEGGASWFRNKINEVFGLGKKAGEDPLRELEEIAAKGGSEEVELFHQGEQIFNSRNKEIDGVLPEVEKNAAAGRKKPANNLIQAMPDPRKRAVLPIGKKKSPGMPQSSISKNEAAGRGEGDFVVGEGELGNMQVAGMQKYYIAALKSGDKEAVAGAQTGYQEKFPNQIEGIEALFQVAVFFDNEKRKAEIDKTKEELFLEMKDIRFFLQQNPDDQEKKAILRGKEIQMNALKNESKMIITELTAYQSLLIHFVKNNPDKKTFLKNFWTAIEQIGNIANNKNESETPVEALKMRAGVLSQVAIMHALEAAGHNPRIVHPKEDAFDKIDLRIGEGGKKVVQVKGTPNEMKVLDIQEVVLPGLQVWTKKGALIHVTDYLAQQHSGFRESIASYKKRLGIAEKVEGCMIAVPHKEMDPVTGVPTDKFKNFIKNELGEK